MNPSQSDFATTGQALLSEVRSNLDPHPTAEELIAYDENQLEATAREQIQDHLALCPECTACVVDLASFPEVEPRDPMSDDTDDAHVPSWESMQARLAAERGGTPKPVLVASPSPPPSISPLYRWAAIAAMPVIAALGLWGFRSEQALHELHRPQINAPYYDLLPLAEDRQRDPDPADLPTVLRGPGSALLVLSLGDPGSFDNYEVQIHRAVGDLVLWQRRGFAPSAYGTFNLTLPRSFLSAGAYRLELHGLSGETSRILAEYRLRIMDE